MTSRRSMGVAIAALAMIFTLAACGRGDDGGGDASPGGAASQAPEVDTGAASGEIDVWAMGTEGEKLGVLADAFMEELPGRHRQRHARAVGCRPRPDRQRHRRRRGSRRQPWSARPGWASSPPSAGSIRPRRTSIGSQFFEGAWNTTVVDGTSYGVPWYVETRLLYYRTDLAEEGGVTEAPANWDDLKALAEAHPGCRRGVRDQPPAGRNRLVADVHAVLLAGRRRDPRRGRRRSRWTRRPASRRSRSTTPSSRRG